MLKLLVFVLLCCHVQSLPYHYAKNRQRIARGTNSRLSPSLSLGLNEAALLKYREDNQNSVHDKDSKESGRMMGLNTGNPEADSEAGMWLMALIGTLAAAVPVAFLSPSLGFKKRSAEDEDVVHRLQANLLKAINKFKENDL